MPTKSPRAGFSITMKRNMRSRGGEKERERGGEKRKRREAERRGGKKRGEMGEEEERRRRGGGVSTAASQIPHLDLTSCRGSRYV